MAGRIQGITAPISSLNLIRETRNCLLVITAMHIFFLACRNDKTNPSADKIMIICKVLNEMIEEDNPPVGILLCTDKGAQMVEYALSGMDNQLFVSTYMLHLPDKQKLEEFLRKELEEIE
ncbi:Protein of unknown function [Lachnospiraceae bacterium C7]|nr:Protein of unknown function [Lachnospiraceae bacterium C7]